MSEQRKQHYVPQTYLKNFATGKKGMSFFTLSKSLKKIYPDSVDEAAAERHFYTLDSCEDKYFWDDLYSKIVEPELQPLLHKIRQTCENVLVQDNVCVISEEDKKNLMFHLIFQLLRGKQTREYEEKIYNETLPKVYKLAKNNFPQMDNEKLEKSFLEFKNNSKYFKSLAMESVLSEQIILRFAKILINYKYVFYRTNGNPPIITSDNPVMLFNADNHNVRPFSNGLLLPTTVLSFPISPKLLLCAYNPYRYKSLTNSNDCILKIMDNKKTDEFICEQNRMQLNQCFDHIYSHSKETLEKLFKYI